jgi:hypothetical protein
MGLSGQDLQKKSAKNEGIKRNVSAIESNEGRDQNMVEILRKLSLHRRSTIETLS